MTGFGSMSFIMASLVGLLCLFCTSEAQSNQDCCLSYMRTELPRRAINGYTEQLSNEICDIGAIFPHKEWVESMCKSRRQLGEEASSLAEQKAQEDVNVRQFLKWN
ncbi:unnamed protein product [Caretta caretta]